MAKSIKVISQDYPRIQDENSPYHGCLDDSTLAPHKHKVAVVVLKKLIRMAIDNANKKSSRAILSIPEGATQQEIDDIYAKAGKQLFKYFKKYCGDPASTAHQIHGKHYREVGKEQFHNRTLQKERMNSGWRYQFLTVDCARHSNRFESVSDIGAAEGDFNAIIEFVDMKKSWRQCLKCSWSRIPPMNYPIKLKYRTNYLQHLESPVARPDYLMIKAAFMTRANWWLFSASKIFEAAGQI